MTKFKSNGKLLLTAEYLVLDGAKALALPTSFGQQLLIENNNINLQFYEGLVVGIELPDNVTLKVEETESVVKGQTASSSYKPALLTGGIKTSVPPFISAEDFVVISTTDSSYIEKAKK